MGLVEVRVSWSGHPRLSKNDIQMGNDNAHSLDKVYSRRKNKTLSDILKLS